MKRPAKKGHCDGNIAGISSSSSDATAPLNALDGGLPTIGISKLLKWNGGTTYTDKGEETTPLANEPRAPNRGTMGIGKAGRGQSIC